MALTPHFYYGTTRKLIVAFGTLFNGIKVYREDGKQISVPLTYASKEKFYLRLKQNANLDKQQAITLPRMGFIITDVVYESERKVPSLGKFTRTKVDPQSQRTAYDKMYLPVPYNIMIELSIYSRNMEDGLQILEQIIPFFKPSFNITIVEIAEVDIERDIPIVLDSISHTDESEGDFESFRILRWDLNFTLKANYYGPVGNTKIIKRVYVDYHTNSENPDDTINERYYVKVDPECALFTEPWEYNEEIISEGTDHEVIPEPEDDITPLNC